MEILLLPLIISPLLIIASFYRTWQLINQKINFKNKISFVFYISFLIISISGFFYVGWHFFQCVWPYQCGEGFASGFIAAGILRGIGIMSIVYIVSEAILFAGRKRYHK